MKTSKLTGAALAWAVANPTDVMALADAYAYPNGGVRNPDHQPRYRAALHAAVEAMSAELERYKTMLAEADFKTVKLTEELEAAKEENTSITNDALKFVAERDALKQELDALEPDAARHRWLREMHDSSDNVTLWHVRGSAGQPLMVGELDAAIDAAMTAAGAAHKEQHQPTQTADGEWT